MERTRGQMPHAYASQTAEQDLPALLDRLAEQLRYVYLETATTVEWRPFQAGEALPACLRGRVFGETCDVQYQQEAGGYTVLVLADSGRLSIPDADTLDLGDLDREETQYVLWGERRNGAEAWSEPGFRQQWRYPVEGAPARVAVRVVEYRDRETGELQFRRYASLVPLEEVDESV